MAVDTKQAVLSDNEREALESLVKRLHAEYNGHIESVMLFGSKARGDFGPDSDIDVAVVLDNDDPHLRSDVRGTAADVSLEYDVLISVRAIGRSHWERISHYRFPFYQSLETDGIPLTGDSE